jgi:hypothetical protein
MKRRLLIKLIRDVVHPHFPELTHSDLILYAKPINSVLRGITFSTQLRHPDALAASVFARPLYVPSAAPIGPWFKRARRGLLDPRDVWYIQEFESDVIKRKLVRGIQRNMGILPSVAEPRLFARNVIRKFGRANIYVEHHEIGLSFARCGELQKSRKHLQRILTMGPTQYDKSDRIPNARRIVDLIDAGKFEEVSSQLDSWQSETIAQIESFGFKMDR